MQLYKIAIILMICSCLFGCLGDRNVSPKAVTPGNPMTGIATLLPQNTVLLLQFPNVGTKGTGFALTNFGKLIQEPEFKEFAQPFNAKFQELVKVLSAFAREFGQTPLEMIQMLQGEIAIALTQLPNREIETPGIVISLEFNALEKDYIWKKARPILEKLLRRTSYEKIRDVEFLVFKPSHREKFYIGLIGNRFVISTTQTIVEQMMAPGENTLAKNPAYMEIVQQTVGQSQVIFHAYCGLKEVWTLEEIPIEVKSIADMTGLVDWQSIGISYGCEGDQFRESFALYCPGTKRGITKMLYGEASQSSLLKFVPSDSSLYIEFSWNLADAWKALMNLSAQIIPPREFTMIQKVVPILNETADILREYGKEFAYFARAPKEGGFFNQAFWLFSVGNREKLSQALAQFFKAWGLECKQTEYAGYTVYYWQNQLRRGERFLEIERHFDPKLLGAILPYRCYCFLDDQTIVYSSQVHSMKDYLDSLKAQAPTLSLQAELQAAGTHSSFLWQDKSKGDHGAGYRNLLGTIQSLEGFARDFGIPLETAFLPQPHVWEKYWKPVTYVGKSNADSLAGTFLYAGIPDFAAADIPSLSLGSAQFVAIPIIAAIAIPGLLESRRNANTMSAIGTLKSMATSQAVFLNDAVVDQDKDGSGEYGFLQELSGHSILRGRDIKASPSYLSTVFVPNEQGICMKGGYCYKLFMPAEDGYIGESYPLPDQKPSQKVIDLQESKYIIYAWPAKYGNTGHSAFVLDASCRIWSCDNRTQRYSGTEHAPQFNAAMPPGSTEIREGFGQDGEYWFEKY